MMESSNNKEYEYISNSEYEDLTAELSDRVVDSEWEPDAILCIARGGLRSGDQISRILAKPLGIMSAQSYTLVGNNVMPNIQISPSITGFLPDKLDRLLLVDDLIDSGKTLQKVLENLSTNSKFSQVEIRTAVIWYKDTACLKPDYYVHSITGNTWIVQPFELWDTVK